MACLDMIGFAPNWYEGQNNAGLAIYVSPGSISGVVYQGSLIKVPQNTVTAIWITQKGQYTTGPTFPDNTFGNSIYPIAIVVSGTVLTGTGVNINAPQRTQDPGIKNITDVRALFGKFCFVMLANNEVVTFTGTTGRVQNTPNGTFFLLAKNGQILNLTTDYTMSGPNINLVVTAQPGDIYSAWYTF